MLFSSSHLLTRLANINFVVISCFFSVITNIRIEVTYYKVQNLPLKSFFFVEDYPEKKGHPVGLIYHVLR